MAEKPVESYDRYTDTKDRKILTWKEHGIPGLRMFGYHQTSRAKKSLVPHYHRSCFEFTYLVQGNICFYIGEKRYDLAGGDMFVTMPDEAHSTGDTPLSLHQMYWFQIEADHPENFIFMEQSRAQWLLEQLRQLPNRRMKMEHGMEPLLKQIFADLEDGAPESQMQAANLLSVLLCQILKNADAHGVGVTPDIRRAEDYILQHICEPITLEKLAGEAMLSESRFKQKFKAQLGTGPRGFINFHKIEKAKEMLCSGRNATDTAMNLGFSGSDYFSVVFRRYTSISPTEYVKKQNSGNP